MNNKYYVYWSDGWDGYDFEEFATLNDAVNSIQQDIKNGYNLNDFSLFYGNEFELQCDRLNNVVIKW